MSTFTTDQGLIIPSLTDAANLITAFGDYNTNLETRLAKRYESSVHRAAVNTAPELGERSLLKDTLRAEFWNGTAYKSEALTHRRPMARATRSTAQSIANGSSTEYITFDTEDFDTDGMFAPSSTTITVVTSGLYIIAAYNLFVANANGIRSLLVERNGSTIYDDDAPGNASSGTTQTAFTVMSLSAGDTMRLRMYQNSGGALNTNATFASSWLSLIYMSPSS